MRPLLLHQPIFLALFMFLAGIVATDAAPTPAFAGVGAAGTVNSGLINEASGLVASRQNPGVLWTHNDSTFPIFALSTNGALLGRYFIPGVNSGDLEDIAIGPGPSLEHQNIYVGDIGDNFASRASIRVFRFPEPSVYLYQANNPRLLESVSAAQTLVLMYPDGPHDAEAMLVDPFTGDLFITTKATGFAVVYRATRAQMNEGGTIVLSPVRTIGLDRISAGTFRRTAASWPCGAATGPPYGIAASGKASAKCSGALAIPFRWRVNWPRRMVNP